MCAYIPLTAPTRPPTSCGTARRQTSTDRHIHIIIIHIHIIIIIISVIIQLYACYVFYRWMLHCNVLLYSIV